MTQPSAPPPRSAGGLLPGSLALCFLVAVGLGAYALLSLRAALVRDWGVELAGRAAGVADALDRFLLERAGDIRVLARHPLLIEGSGAEQGQVLQAFRDSYEAYAWLGLAGPDGHIRAATDPASVGLDVGREPWFRAARDSGALEAGEIGADPLRDGRATVSFSAPLRGPRGEFRGVVSSRVTMEQLSRFIRAVGVMHEDRQAEYDWLLLDARGAVIAEAKEGDPVGVNLLDLGLPSAVLAARAPSGRAGYVEEEHLRRRAPVLTGYARMRGRAPGFDWTVLVRVDRERVYAPVDRLVWQVGGLGLGLVAPLTGFGIWAARRLVRERRVLAEVAQGNEERALALRALVDNVRTLTAVPHVDRFLLALLESARTLTGARYAALSVADPEAEGGQRFLTLGMDAATVERIGRPPAGHGVLGALSPDGKVLRLGDLTEHPASVGMPAHHPVMRSFLGVAILVHGRPYGRLYLTEKEGAPEFTDTDEQVLAALAAQAGVAIDNALLLQEVGRAEAEQRAARTRLASVLEHSPDMIVFTDGEGRIVLFNRGAERLLGYRAEEVIGRPAASLYVEAADRDPLLAELKSRGAVISREVRLRRRDGKPIIISLTLSPYRDAEGRAIGTVGIAKDITAAKGLEAALRASNAELEHFVHAISHDLQTPLRGIHGFADLLLKRTKDRLEGRELHYVQRIQAGTQRMATLINDLFEFSRLDRVTHPFETVDMDRVMGQVVADLKDLIHESRAEIRCDGPLPSVWADRLRMGQLWTNLLSNAIKYVRPGEPPRIDVGAREEADRTLFWVRDQGIGIPAEYHETVFELFRRLHSQEEYEGTGVGLAIVKRIVEFHGGRVWVESAEGRGSTFFFTIPRQAGGVGPQPAPERGRPESSEGGGA